jgi:hypothetical protein
LNKKSFGNSSKTMKKEAPNEPLKALTLQPSSSSKRRMENYIQSKTIDQSTSGQSRTDTPYH